MNAPEPSPASGDLASATDLTTRYAGALMNTFGPPKRVLVRGRGCHVWDADGIRYLDLMAGIAVNALGHAHPAIVEAMTRQASQLGQISNFFASEPQVALAERLLGLTGVDDGRVFFCNSGTEANEAGVKLTRRTGRTRIVAAEGAFHGRTLGALALTAKQAYREPFEPLPGDVAWVPFGDVEALAAAVDDHTAAVVLEPVQGEAGAVVPPDGYLSAARAICDRAGALLWFDEVQTGVGRTGRWFGYQAEAVRPDVITLAKGLGGGFPIGACIGLGAAGSLLGPGHHGTTFGGNPVACATASAVLDVIERDGLLDQVSSVGCDLAERLRLVDGVGAVRGRGLLLAAEVAPGTSGRVTAAALERGVIVNDPTPDWVRLAPPLVLEHTHVDEAIPVLTAAVAAQRHPQGVS
jgi:acetylornithine/N-succinyldiaminopimelate aminotransferase